MIKLVTGAAGLIGSEFKDCVRVTRQTTDLIDPIQVNLMYEINKPEYVIHTAGRVGGVGANMKYKADFYYENIMMNTNVIHYAKKHNVKKLIAFLSTCIFPDKVEYPLNEDKIHLGPPHISNDAYAYAKRMVDVQVNSYNEQFGTKYFCVIPTNVYGPNDNYDLENGHVVPSIIHKCYNAIMNKTDLVLWGDGSPLREFIFSKDVANICDLLLENYDDTKPVILSTSEEISIKEVANMITKIMGYKKDIVWDTTKPAGQYRKPSDNSRLKSIIGNYKFTPIEKGLEETITTFLSNYENLRK